MKGLIAIRQPLDPSKYSLLKRDALLFERIGILLFRYNYEMISESKNLSKQEEYFLTEMGALLFQYASAKLCAFSARLQLLHISTSARSLAVKEDRHNSHSVTRLTAHIVWVTKYRYHVLQGDIKVRCRDLIVQICDSEDVRILKGVVSKDHVHIHIEYPPSKSISDLVKRFKGRTSRLLQQEYPELKRRYWGKHFWAIGYGAWSTGNITEEMVQEYLEHHRDPSNRESTQFILEQRRTFSPSTTYALSVHSGLV